MPTLFISHSGKDQSSAEEIAEYLRKNNIESFFLDFDPEVGIPPGRNWAKELYQNLLSCQVVIYLCSPNSLKSKWCFVEIAQAQALQRHIIPLIITPCDLDNILKSSHYLELWKDPEQAVKRLLEELELIGVLEEAKFTWDQKRPPYPGMAAFDIDDAATFYGRKKETHELLTLFERLRDAEQGLIQVIGASGSGKSSLIRAGVLPVIQRDPEKWLVLQPEVAGVDSLENLAEEIISQFPDKNQCPDYEQVLTTINNQASATDPEAETGFSSLLRKLRLANGQKNVQFLWVIDQAERLVVAGKKEKQILQFIRQCVLDAGLPFKFCLVLRLDHFDVLNTQLGDMHIDTFIVGPLLPSRYAEVIEGPAQLAGLSLGPGLVPALTQDAQGRDGLPLLAFVLRELWDKFGKSTHSLSLDDYLEKLGGLQGCVARKIEAIMNALNITEEQQTLLEQTFCRMATISDTRTFIARPLAWKEVPEIIYPIFKRLIEERLLVKRKGNHVEFAHEVLFQAWDDLKGWLEKYEDYLLWERRLSIRVEKWKEHDRKTEKVFLSGVDLDEANTWYGLRSELLDEDQRKFITESLHRAQQEEQRWYENYQISSARQLAAHAQLIIQNESAELTDRGLLLGVEAMVRFMKLGQYSLEADQAVRQGLAILTRKTGSSLGNDINSSEAVAIHPNAFVIVYGEKNGSTWLWDLFKGTRQKITTLNASIESTCFSSEGKWLFVGDNSGNLQLFVSDTMTLQSIQLPEKVAPIRSVCFSQDSRYLAVAFSNTVAVWALEDSSAPIIFDHKGGTPVVSIVFSPDNEILVTQVVMGETKVWRWREKAIVGNTNYMSNYISYSPDGRYLGGSGTSYIGWLWDVYQQENHELANYAAKLKFSPDGQYVAVASPQHFVRVWTLPDLVVVHTMPHNAEVWDLNFSPDSSHLVSIAKDDVAYVWSMSTGKQTARILHKSNLRTANFLYDSRNILTYSGDGELSVWDTQDLSEFRRLKHNVAVLGVAFDLEKPELIATNARESQYERSATLINWHTQEIITSYQNEDGESVEGAEFARKLLEKHHQKVTGQVQSPNNELLAVRDGTRVIIYRGDTETEEVCSLDHEKDVIAVAFSPDNKYIVTASDHDTARIWEVETGREVSRLTHDNPSVIDVDFSPDGKYIATASWDHTARIWLWQPEDLANEASTRVNRSLTVAEWDKYLPGEKYNPLIKTIEQVNNESATEEVDDVI